MNTEATTTIDHESGVVIPEETKQGIVAMSKVAAGLGEMQKQYSTVPDVETKEGYKEAKRLRKEVATVRIDIEKIRKEAKQFYLNGGRRIDAMAKQITDAITPIEDRFAIAVSEIDERKAAEKAEQDRIERERIAGIENEIARIRALSGESITVADCIASLEMLTDFDSSVFEEFQEAGEKHIADAREDLETKRKALVAQAEEAARLQAQREEQEAAQAKIDAENKRIADERSAFEAEKKAEEERQAQAERERAAAENNRQMKIQAEERAKREKAEAVEQAKRDEAARIERERVKAEERQAAEEAEAARLAALAPDADKLRAWVDTIPELPEMTSDDGKAAAKRVLNHLLELGEAISDLQYTATKDAA